MKRLCVVLTALALIAGLIGCSVAPVEVGLAVNSTSGGSVTSPGEGAFSYTAGTMVELVAVADGCYDFVNWTGDAVTDSDSPSTTIIMDTTKSVTANFALRTHELTVEPEAGGSVIEPGEGVFSYACGTTVALVAEADRGYRFLNWTGDADTIGDATSAQTTITMDDSYFIGARFRAAYSIYDTVVEGLSTPMMRATDRQGRIYFTEFDDALRRGSIHRFDSVTGRGVRLIEHNDATVHQVSVDAENNLYYVLRYHAEPPIAQIRKLGPGEEESGILFGTEESDHWLQAFAVDSSGNVYFSLQSTVDDQLGPLWPYWRDPSPGSKLHRILAGTTTTETLLMLEDSLEMSNIVVDDDRGFLHFISTWGVQRIHRFDPESRALGLVLERTGESHGRIAYLFADADGVLYYLYRQRSDPNDPVPFGYLEIGRFTLEALETGQSPDLLVADELDRPVSVVIPVHCVFAAAADTGDVFFTMALPVKSPAEQLMPGIFRYDPLTGTYAAIVEGTYTEVGIFTFVLDDDGNVYYAAALGCAIVRVNN